MSGITATTINNELQSPKCNSNLVHVQFIEGRPCSAAWKDRRPADVFIPRWAGGRDAALDVTVTHPLQAAFRARAATEPGYAMAQAYKNKMRITADLCKEQGICFIPVVAESTGGWHKIAIEQLKKLGPALARHTGQEEGETIAHLVTRVSVQLQKGLSAMILNRIPSHAAPVDGGVQ